MHLPRFAAPLLVSLLCGCFSITARAAVYVPSKLGDSADGSCDADCSLREAVIAANAHAGDDVLLLHAGTYRMEIAGVEDAAAAGDLDVLDDLTVIGDGASRTVIDGGAIDRILHLQFGASLDLRDVTLRNGRAIGGGGAILNFGDLTITRCLLEHNRSVSGADFGDGGAIVTLATGPPSSRLTVVDSTFSGNDADRRGGAIFAAGPTTLRNVTLSENSATIHGGGIYVTSGAVVELGNATLAGNFAGSGGGGLFTETTAFIGTAPKATNSILARNNAPAGPDCLGDLDSGYDLIGNNSGCNGPSAAKHDLVGTAAAPLDPRLDALQNLGGPTPVRPLHVGHGLDPGSPAIDAGDPAAPGSTAEACAATDQRGADRPAGPRCDIGAFELSSQCVSGGRYLCMIGDRFRVDAHWQTPNGGQGFGEGVQLTPESGYFWFFGPDNVEVTVKVLDGCALNDRFWVFSSGMTNVNVVLTVVDTLTQTGKSYTNPLNHVFTSILDTNAFSCH